MVDICGEVNGFALVIYFSYPDRSGPITLEEPRNTRCGILEIDLTWTRALFLKKKTTFERFADEIRAFIEDSNHAKKWIFHPRTSAAMSQARTRLEAQIISWVPPQQRKYIRKNPYVRFDGGGNQHYECVVCKIKWSGFENEKQLCPFVGHIFTCVKSEPVALRGLTLSGTKTHVKQFSTQIIPEEMNNTDFFTMRMVLLRSW